MRHALAVVLLVVAVGGAIARPWRLPAWIAPTVAAVVALAARTLTIHEARTALHPLAEPLLFVALAVPLAVMLDAVGIFEELAGQAARSRRVVGACWILAAAVVAVLNLDAAVVLLTPIYVRTARQVGVEPAMLAFQPVLLAMLASSVLPVSNLTNLVVASRLSLTTTDFLAHLAGASLVASLAGWFAFRRVFPAHATAASAGSVRALDRRALTVGGGAIAVFLVLLVGGEHLGVPAWAAALGAIVVLAAAGGALPWRHVPLGTIVLAAALVVVASGAALAYPHVLTSAGDGGVRGFAAGVVSGNLLNNLPATIVALPHVTRTSRVWPLLLGLNAGPSLLLTGSLAGLLWQASASAAGVHVSAREFTRVGVLVGVPAMAAGFVALQLFR